MPLLTCQFCMLLLCVVLQLIAISILARVYSYYSYCQTDLCNTQLSTETYVLHSYHSCDTQYPHTLIHDILLIVHLKLCYCELLLESYASIQLNIHYVAETCAVVPVYFGRLEAVYKCPDCEGQFIC